MSELLQIYPWQYSTWNALIHYCHNGNLPAALILHGNEGIGKFNLACAFAKMLLCAMSEKEACLNCHSCQLFVSKNHPDFYSIALETDSDVIKIDQIRTLIEQLSQTPKISKRQVVVIRAAERMNASAANALLKTLEETPGDVIFLLTCSKINQLPVTIRSRCQLQPCTITDQEAGLKWLVKQISNEISAKLLWRISDQSPLLAKQLFEDDYLKVRDIILQNMQELNQKNKLPIDAAKVVSTFNIMLILRSWSSLMHDLWQIKLQIDLKHCINQDQINTLEILAKRLQQSSIERFYMELLGVINAEQKGMNLNKALLLDNLWVQFSHFISETNVE